MRFVVNGNSVVCGAAYWVHDEVMGVPKAAGTEEHPAVCFSIVKASKGYLLGMLQTSSRHCFEECIHECLGTPIYLFSDKECMQHDNTPSHISLEPRWPTITEVRNSGNFRFKGYVKRTPHYYAIVAALNRLRKDLNDVGDWGTPK